MSQTKVQLIQPIGVVTASTLETTGVLTATTFVGDIAGTVTGITSTTDNLNLGIITATSFAGDFTGIGSGLTGTPNVVAGIVTATKFVGNTPGLVSGVADGTNINAGIITATSFVGNITGNAAGLSTTTAQVTLGIVTATSYSGSGANLEGVSSGPVAQQAVTANGATTTIDLSSGNLIYMTQSANTTVAFANTEGNTDVVYLVRTKDDTTTARTITWPSGMVWDGGTAPTLLTNPRSTDAQVFKLTTRDNGAIWYGVEVVNADPQNFTLWGWGKGTYGNLGQNNRTNYSSPVQIPGTTWSSLGDYYEGWNGVAINTSNELWSWGYNYMGGLGQNSRTRYSSPVQIPGTTWARTWNSGEGTYFGVKSDNTLWSWGYNQSGALGHNNAHPAGNLSSPVQVPGTTWSSGRYKNAAGPYSNYSVKTDGTLWVWGRNGDGMLGLNNNTKYSSPVQIPGTTWSSVGGSLANGYAIKTDGTLWSWGDGTYGRLGQGAPTSSISSPKQVPGTTWSQIDGGYRTVGAIKTDGTLWMWGEGDYGAQGHNDVTHYSSPKQVPGTTWGSVSCGKYWTIATKTDNTLWTWGKQEYGALGQNSTTYYSSPVQVPGTSWAAVSASYGTAFALQYPS